MDTKENNNTPQQSTTVVCRPTSSGQIVTALIRATTPKVTCRQCSSCHGCR